MNSGILVELKTENGIRNLSVDRGIGLRELAEKYHNGEGEFPPVFATVDGEITGMGSELRHSSMVEFYDMRSRLGRLMYQRTVYFLFQIAVNELIPGIRTTLRYPINDGLLVEFDRKIDITKVFAWNVEKKMREIIAAGRPFEKQVLSREEIVSMGRPSYLSDRLVDLMLTGDADQVYVYSYGSFREEFIDPLRQGSIFSNWCLMTGI